LHNLHYRQVFVCSQKLFFLKKKCRCFAVSNWMKLFEAIIFVRKMSKLIKK
jgi:hypothetical protein